MGAQTLLFLVFASTLTDAAASQTITATTTKPATTTTKPAAAAPAVGNSANATVTGSNNTDIKASVPEGSLIGYLVVNVTAFARNGEAGGNITFSLLNDQGMFRIDPVSGVVTVASNNTDREAQEKYVLVVQKQNGKELISNISLTITMDDVNDNPPIFHVRNLYEGILKENSLNFSQAIRLEATDSDQPLTQNSNITYSLSTSTPSGLDSYFHIDPLTGELTVVQPLDFDNISFSAEQPGTIILTAVATDNGSLPLNTTVSVVITLLDVNDNAPEFQNLAYYGTVFENATVGTQVVTVTATDNDGTFPNNQVFYFLESGGRDQFAINHTTGVISVQSELDRETVSHYILQVLARDQGAEPLSSYCNVSIEVRDVNDELPTFGEKSHVVTDISESTYGDIYDMSAEDPDLDKSLQYSILWSESHGQAGVSTHIPGENLETLVQIDSHNGMVSAREPFDRNQVRRLQLTVLVEDTNAFDPRPQQVTGLKVPPSGRIRDASRNFPTPVGITEVDKKSQGVTQTLMSRKETADVETLCVNFSAGWNVDTNWIPFGANSSSSCLYKVFVSQNKFIQTEATLTIIVTESLRFRRSALVPEINSFKVDSHVKSQGDKKLDTEVAFAAGLTHQVEMSESQRVVYDRIFMNHGSAYNNRTGTFTCPQSGLYTFEVHTSAPRDSTGRLSLQHNDNSVMTVVAKAEKPSAAKGNSAVLHLSKGDDVYVTSTPGVKIQLLGAPHLILNTFSGYLISPDLKGLLRKGN